MRARCEGCSNLLYNALATGVNNTKIKKLLILITSSIYINNFINTFIKNMSPKFHHSLRVSYIYRKFHNVSCASHTHMRTHTRARVCWQHDRTTVTPYRVIYIGLL